MRGRLGICGHNSGRRNSSAQITTIDAIMDTSSLGKTGSDPVDEEKNASSHQSGSKDRLIDRCNLTLFVSKENYCHTIFRMRASLRILAYCSSLFLLNVLHFISY